MSDHALFFRVQISSLHYYNIKDAVNQSEKVQQQTLTCELHVARQRGHRQRPTKDFRAGRFSAFPEIGSVEDSRNSRNNLVRGGGVETGREIWVSVEEWC